MPKSGGVDYSQLEQFCKDFKELEKAQDRFYVQASKGLAARLLQLVIPATPKGIYDQPVHFFTKDGKEVSFTPHTGKVGGTLVWHWVGQPTHGQGTKPSASDMARHVRNLPVTKSGDTYRIVVSNNTEYAAYVEFGHRTVNGGWYEGLHFLTITEDRLRPRVPIVLEHEFERFVREWLK